MPRRTHLALACLSVLLAPACAEDPSGTPPSVEDLALTPMTVAVGSTTQVQGSLHFTDPDADVRDLEITLTPPAGAAATVELAISGADGKVEADTTFILAITAPQAGDYEVKVVLIDAEGHESDASVATVTAQ